MTNDINPLQVSVELGKVICAAFGIDPNKVSRIDLHLPVGEYATLDVTYLAKITDAEDRLQAVSEALMKYEITTPDDGWVRDGGWVAKL
jgi:hypothetical protein